MAVAPGGRDLVARLMDGYLGTQLVYVAARLGLADLLAKGPQSAAHLAAAAGADPHTLHRILRALAVYGLLYEVEEMFGLTDAGRYLQSDAGDSLRGAILSRGDLYYQAAAGLLQSVQRGSVAFQDVHGTKFFDHLAASPARLAAFQQSMVARSQLEAADLLHAHDFGAYRHVIDVGGGFGVTLTAILTAYPALRGTLFDRPEVTREAQVRLNAAGIADRCRRVSCQVAMRRISNGSSDVWTMCRCRRRSRWHSQPRASIGSTGTSCVRCLRSVRVPARLHSWIDARSDCRGPTT
jgi:hypothetical protein